MANSLCHIDRNTSTITVTSTYQASIEQVWAAWPESDILDQSRVPHRWKVVTKEDSFCDENGVKSINSPRVINGVTQWYSALVAPR